MKTDTRKERQGFGGFICYYDSLLDINTLKKNLIIIFSLKEGKKPVKWMRVGGKPKWLTGVVLIVHWHTPLKHVYDRQTWKKQLF